MKRITYVLLVAIVICTLAFSALLVSCNGKTKKTNESDYGKFISDGKVEISVGVLADVHVMSQTQAVNMTCEDYKAWEAHGQKMLGLSESLLKTAVDRIIQESDFDVVLVSGDNADDGGKDSHLAVKAQLARLEKAGIKVFTIPGNHDLNNKSYTYTSGKAVLTEPTDEADFAEIYADFGYSSSEVLEFYKNANGSGAKNEANFERGDNLSYVADLNDKYRLIAIDMSNHAPQYTVDGQVKDLYVTDDDGSYAAAGYEVDDQNRVLINGEPYPTVKDRHDGAMTADLLKWAQRKIKEACDEGKIPLGMMHFPLLQHFGSLIQADNAAVNDPKDEKGNVMRVAETLADAGLKFIFTGHVHIQDDARYTTKAGNSVLDINSASLCNYPTPIRIFRVKGNEAIVRTWNMNYVSEKYLPSYLSQDENKEEKQAILSNFSKYSVDYLDGSMLAKIKNKIDLETIESLLAKIGVEESGAVATEVSDLIQTFLTLPLYEKNAKGGLSVESVAKTYGVTIPTSEYTDVFNLAMTFVAGVYGGDETCSADEVRVTLLKYSLFTAVKMIADFGIEKINPAFAGIDLASAIPDLFEYGILEVCSNNLLVGILSEVWDSIDNKTMDQVKAFIKINKNTNPCDLLTVALGALDMLDAFNIPSIDKVKGLIAELEPKEYVAIRSNSGSGFIRLGQLIDDKIDSFLLLGLTNDSLEESTYSYQGGVTDNGVPDNDLKINITTMAYTALK